MSLALLIQLTLYKIIINKFKIFQLNNKLNKSIKLLQLKMIKNYSNNKINNSNIYNNHPIE